MPLFGPPGERIAYFVFEGPPGAPPVVLLHGFTASSASFVENIEGLRRYFTVVAVELLGHGDSEAPEDPSAYRPERALERLEALLDSLGYEEVLLCGHSLGGALTLLFAIEHPERTAGVVVINSNSSAGDAAWRETARESLAALAERVQREGTAFLKETRLYPGNARRLPERARQLLAEDFDRLTPQGVAHTATELVAKVDTFERLAELRVPALVVIGDRDAEFVENAPRLLRAIPPGLARQVTLRGAGHAANLEAPAEFERAVVEFAREIGYLPGASGAGERANTVLTVLGGLLVAAGLALIGASVLTGSGEPSLPAAGHDARETPTAVEEVAGAQQPGTASPTRGAGTSTPTPRWVTPSPLPSPTMTVASSASTPTAVPPSTPTPVPPTATPTTPPPTPTPTPLTPEARIAGPTTAAVGEVVNLVNASTGLEGSTLLDVSWSTSGGTFVATGQDGAAIRFDEAGCFRVSMVLYFTDREALVAAHSIAVGDALCE